MKKKSIIPIFSIFLCIFIFIHSFFSFSFYTHELNEYPPSKNGYANNYWQPYVIRMEGKIKANWKPTHCKGKKPIVEIKIGKNGNLLSCDIFKSSKYPNIDKSALDAVRLAAPFERLPNEFKGDYIIIKFVFDYGDIKKQPFNIAIPGLLVQ